ncbi:photosystem II 47 kDa protein [Iris pallida]|uniref:Photosystem II 47 kDa protein (Chloroplast) n=1 Tax=Iris pallida TaxID=29817 RepID=A0AAX6E4W1_IRIPA|nr:photosystem II 47 kDa protein [Iris pallida]
MDQNLLCPTTDLQIVLFQLVHKDRIPIFQDQINLLHKMHQSQSKLLLKEINEFQRSWANPKKVFLDVHHRIFLGPNTPNARWLPRNTCQKT